MFLTPELVLGLVLNNCDNPDYNISNDKTAQSGLVIERRLVIAVHFLPKPQLPLLLFLLRIPLSQHWQGKLHSFSNRKISHVCAGYLPSI